MERSKETARRVKPERGIKDSPEGQCANQAEVLHPRCAKKGLSISKPWSRIQDLHHERSACRRSTGGRVSPLPDHRHQVHGV